jgi:hypothetical protein
MSIFSDITPIETNCIGRILKHFQFGDQHFGGEAN